MADQENLGLEKKKSLREKAVHKIKVKCTDKVANIANLIACAGLLLGAILRFNHSFTVSFNLFYFLETLYFLSFIIILSLAEILYLCPRNKLSLYVRTYYNFLNKLIGRGMFLIFLSMIMVSKTD